MAKHLKSVHSLVCFGLVLSVWKKYFFNLRHFKLVCLSDFAIQAGSYAVLYGKHLLKLYPLLCLDTLRILVFYFLHLCN